MPALSIADAFEMALATQVSPVAGLEPCRSACCCTRATRSGRRTSMPDRRAARALHRREGAIAAVGTLSVLAPAAAGGDAVNLMQGALAVSSPRAAELEILAHRRLAGAALLCLHLGARDFELSRLDKRRPCSMRASRTRSARPCPASRTPPMRGAASRTRLAQTARTAAAARCCRRCRPSPLARGAAPGASHRRAHLPRRHAGAAHHRAGRGQPRRHRPPAARAQLAGRHPGWQRQR